ncbi:MAG: M28 family peptidase [Verrucomicrobiota bacterium]|nr:M28 family peptidase [Verrucomicrobiota bacterium]
MPNKKKRSQGQAVLPGWRSWGGYVLLGLAVLVAILFLRSRPVRDGEPWKEFSGEKALAHVQALVDFGPRPAGSDAIKQARAYLRQNLEANGWQVVEQPFTDKTPRGPVEFVNLIARRPDAADRLFLLGSHYDTKIFDSIRFVGANDGGSSTGALLEMARVLNLHPSLASQIELVFFDGEEAYERFTQDDGLFGSRHFAEQVRQAGQVRTYRGAIVWDMMGDRDLTITLPLDSPAKLAEGIFAAAEALQVRDHFSYADDKMIDDHVPLNAVGIPTIDLIDFEYPPWHTFQDTMDKLSAESLQTVGAVTLYYLVKRGLK